MLVLGTPPNHCEASLKTSYFSWQKNNPALLLNLKTEGRNTAILEQNDYTVEARLPDRTKIELGILCRCDGSSFSLSFASRKDEFERKSSIFFLLILSTL